MQLGQRSQRRSDEGQVSVQLGDEIMGERERRKKEAGGWGWDATHDAKLLKRPLLAALIEKKYCTF